MNTNADIWRQLKRPPPEVLKQIVGGRLRGMTDINPQWRYQVMTEQFGPVGIGWKYTIDKLWADQGVGEDKLAFAIISLYVKNGGEWSDAIPGIGGSAMVAKESGGPRSSDECYKMAVTDALSVAMKQLGVAADIYAGLWDGSKYKDQAPPQDGDAPDELVQRAEVAASEGMDSYKKFWSTITDVDRKAIGSTRHEANKKTAAKVAS